MGKLNTQAIVNMAWAFATTCCSESLLFVTLVRAAERCLGEFKMQELATMAYAFATAGKPAPPLLDTIPGMCLSDAWVTQAQVIHCQM